MKDEQIRSLLSTEQNRIYDQTRVSTEYVPFFNFFFLYEFSL